MRLPLTALHNLKRQDSLQWAADQTIFDDAFASLNMHAFSTVLVFQIFIPLKQGKISFGFKKLALSLEGLSF